MLQSSSLRSMRRHHQAADATGAAMHMKFRVAAAYCCCLLLPRIAAAAVNVLADHVAANNMSARHISELRRDLVPDPDIALLAQLSTAAGITLRCVCGRLAGLRSGAHVTLAGTEYTAHDTPAGVRLGCVAAGAGVLSAQLIHRPLLPPPPATAAAAVVSVPGRMRTSGLQHSSSGTRRRAGAWAGGRARPAWSGTGG